MKKLPESEQEIMMIIWEYEEPVSRFQVEEKLNVEKNVAPSTILTLLTRLEKKRVYSKSEEWEIKSLCTISRKRKLYRHGWKKHVR